MMKSNEKSFWEEVGLDSVNMVFRNGESISDQLYVKQIFVHLLNYVDFYFQKVIEKNAYLNKYSTTQQGTRD